MTISGGRKAVGVVAHRKIPSWLIQLLCYLLAVGCLLWVLHDYPLGDLVAAIRDLDWKWIAIAIVSDLTVYVVHAWRWNTLLSPVVRLRLWRTVQAIYISLFANEVFPLRVGEVLRCYLLTHWNDLRLSLGFASAAVERLIDGMWMLVAFLITASFVRGIPHDIVILVQVTGFLLILGVALLVWVVIHKQDAHAVIAESRWAATLRHVIEGLHLMGDLRTLGYTVLISLLYLALQVFSVYALLKAYKTDYSFWVAGGVLTIIRFATVVPNAPGNLGLINVATVTALRLFDFPDNSSKTFSIILFGTLTLPLLIGGAIATAMTGLNLGELRDRAQRSVSNAPPEPAPEGP